MGSERVERGGGWNLGLLGKRVTTASSLRVLC